MLLVLVIALYAFPVMARPRRISYQEGTFTPTH